jgi:outer membrane protein assembly factor BamB
MTGTVLWASHLVKDLGGQRPGWGFSESPLIDGDRLIVTPGGSQGTVAVLDKLTGLLIWRSKAVVDKAHYSSAILADVDGVRQVIQFTGGTGSKRSEDRTPSRVIGLDAANGDLLWDYDKPGNPTASVCTPIYHDGHVFGSSAYGTGGGLVRLTRAGSTFSAEEVYFERAMANHHGGIVLVDGYLYGFGSNSLICLNFATGETAWQNRSVSKGSICYADGHLYCHGEKNQVALVEADPKAYVEKGRFELERLEYPTWTHPVVCNGRLYLRDMDVLTCYDVRSQSSKH